MSPHKVLRTCSPLELAPPTPQRLSSKAKNVSASHKIPNIFTTTPVQLSFSKQPTLRNFIVQPINSRPLTMEAGFDPRPVQDKVAIGLDPIPVFQFSPVSTIPPTLHHTH